MAEDAKSTMSGDPADDTANEQNEVTKSTHVECSDEPEQVADGNRMRSARKAVSATIRKCLSVASYELFSSSFKNLAEARPKIVRSVHQQFIKLVEKSINEEITQVYKQENLVSLMNQMDELDQAGDRGTKAWRPTGDVDEDLRAQILPLKLKHRERLRKIAETLEEENKQLRAAIEPRRQKFLSTQKAVQEHFTQIHQAHNVTKERPWDELTDFL